MPLKPEVKSENLLPQYAFSAVASRDLGQYHNTQTKGIYKRNGQGTGGLEAHQDYCSARISP